MTLPTASMPPSIPPSIPSSIPPFVTTGGDASRGAAPSQELEARVLELRGEVEGANDKTFKAALLYEVAQITESALNAPVQAVQDYLAAYNADHRLRLPLYALLRVFERKRSYKNLQRLYDAELRSARSPVEKATALVDQGVLATITAGDLEVARARFERALEQAPDLGDAAILLEWNRRAAQDYEATQIAALRRAESCDDPIHQGVLLLEVAGIREANGDIGAALETLREAALGPSRQEAFLAALSRLARAHNHTQDLVEATERLAEIVSGELAERMVDEVPDQTHVERLRARAVALWYESARLRCSSLGDAEGALACLAKAFAIRPDDVLLRQTRMLAYDMLEDRERAAREAEALLEEGYKGEHAAALHFRLAEVALVSGDTDSARERLMEAISEAGGSIAADAILDDLLLDEERHRDRIERREARAATADPVRASRALLEAALIAAYGLRDGKLALALLSRADQKTPNNLDVLREAYGAALDLGDSDLAEFAIDRLLQQPLDDDERTALLHHRLERTVSATDAALWIASHESALLSRPSLATLCAVRAAEAGDHALLSRVHEALAEAAAGVDDAVAHLCASARALLRAGNAPGAEDALRRALARSPSQRYALTLLEEVLRDRGESHEVVALLRKSAEAQTNAKDAELSLLLAGAAAEGAGDLARAVQSYEEAADRNPASVGPLWALLRLGQRMHDPALELKAREGLAGREQADGGAGAESLMLAEHYDLVSNKPELSESTLLAVVTSQGTSLSADQSAGLHAAAGLLLLRGASNEAREQAASLLSGQASGPGLASMLREQGGSMLRTARPVATALDIIERCAAASAEDRWALLARTCLSPADQSLGPHAGALDLLAARVDDAALADATRAEALWTRRLSPEAGPIAADLALSAFGPAAALERAGAFAILDLVGPLDSAPRARALATARAQATGAELTDLGHALARAKLSSGDALGAVTVCDELLRADSDDLVALDTLRVASRQCGRFYEVVSTCERLARHVEGEMWAELMEEAAAVRMDVLDDNTGAEADLRRVLELHPARATAYGRLHALLSEREDASELTALVQARAKLVDSPEELAPLFYELARLHRAAGDLESALDALDNLTMLEEHVGGLALQVEIHAAREDWPLAVDALQALAEAEGVPKAQRRLARLGAADFLENRLNDPTAALDELEKLDQGGHGDAALYVRIADVAQRLGRFERAVSALSAAAELARGDARLDALMRAGNLLVEPLHKPQEAEVMYERALSLRPGHAEAAKALAQLCQDADKKNTIATRFETEVRAECAAKPTEAEPLRKLALAAELKAQPDITFTALTTLAALDLANYGEREAADAATRRLFGARVSASAPLSETDLSDLLVPALDVKYAALLRAVLAASTDIDQLEPSRYGVGRGQKVSARETNQVRDEVSAMANALGLQLTEFYVGGDEPNRLAAFAKDNECAFVVGVGVTAPLGNARRYQAALHLASIALSTQPLLTRSPAQGARLLQAALVAADAPLPAGVARDDLGEQPRMLSKVLPRKVRKAIPDLARALPDGGAKLERQCRTALRHSRRLALLLSGDLQASLDSVLGTMPTRDAIAESDDALDLVRAWTSAPMLMLRKKLGLAR